MLNGHMAKILSSIGSEDGIQLQIYCRTINHRAARGKKGSRRPGDNELQYVMNTIIYGPEDLHDSVGDYALSCGIFLQDPVDCDRNVFYSNPQVLCRSGERLMTYDLASLNRAPEIEKFISQDDIFSKLSSDDYLPLTEAPDTIRTTLYRYQRDCDNILLLTINNLRHQKKALSFMIKREDGWQHDGSPHDLWAREVDETGQML
jgi:SWI/SNF-related matrix-associated actin-dependent regulator of chromatin subfamily A3